MQNTERSAPNPQMVRRVARASAIGTTVEWSDYFIYATASALAVGKLFSVR